MGRATGMILGGTLATVALSVFLAAPGEKPVFKSAGITLGLDLQGGAELLFAPNYDGIEDPIERKRVKEDPKTLDAVVEIVRRRVDIYGLREVGIRKTDANRVRVVLPGRDEEETTRISRLIQTAGRIEFRIVAAEAVASASPYPIAPPKHAWLERRDGAEGGGRRLIIIQDRYDFTGRMLGESKVELGEWGQNVVAFKVQTQYVERFERLTGENIGKPMAIILDNKVVSDPTINDRIGAAGIIKGGGVAGFRPDEAQDLATVLKSGAMPVGLKLESQNIVGPGLGEDSIKAGIRAGLIGGAAIVVVMIGYYFVAGILATLGMAVVAIWILGIMAGLNATLSLPGIAGLILTVGMAVDSNILIYERIREELKRGNALLEAVRLGYERATETILDSNITTLLTGFILYLAGEGPVQGFAITLCIGIVATMVAVLLPTRALLLWLVERGAIRQLRMMDAVGVPNLGYTKLIGPCLTVSGLVIAAGLALFFQRGDKNLGLDFLSGTLVQFETRAPLSIEEVRRTLATTEVTLADGTLVRPYATAEVQSVSRPGHASAGSEFQVRTELQDQEIVRNDVGRLFAERLSPPAFGEPRTVATGVQWTLVVGLRTAERVGSVRSVLEEAMKGVNDAAAAAGGPTEAVKVGPVAADASKERVDQIQIEIESRPRRDGETRATLDAWLDAAATQIGAKLSAAAFEATTPIVKSRVVDETFELHLPINLREPVEPTRLQEICAEAGFGEAAVVRAPGQAATGAVTAFEVVRVKLKAGEEHADLLKRALREKVRAAGLHLSEPFPLVTKISPAVAGEMRQKGTLALVLSLLVIVVYMALRFRGSGGDAAMVEGFTGLLRDLMYRARFGLAAVVALTHNVLVTLGAVAAVDHFGLISAKIDLAMVAAFLTIVGYSLNDTIVVFDRLRENLRKFADKPLRELIDLSVNQTMSRTLLTGGSVLVATTTMMFFGAESTKGFSFAMTVGIVVGTYSSVYIAAPLLLLWEKPAAAGTSGGKPAAA